MHRAAAFLALAFLSVAPAVAVSGEPSTPTPFEHVHAVAFDAAGRALWLGAHTGLYRSDDGGRTWSKVAVPAQGHDADVMAVIGHPNAASVVYVGTHEAGVLKTTDGGETWVAVNTGLRGLDVHGLAIDPNTPDKLHAIVREMGAGLYRTTDGGQKWVRVDDGPAGETKVLASVNIANTQDEEPRRRRSWTSSASRIRMDATPAAASPLTTGCGDCQRRSLSTARAALPTSTSARWGPRFWRQRSTRRAEAS